MESINLANISWLRTSRNGYLYPCLVVDTYTIKILLTDKILRRRDKKEPRNADTFWDDR